MGAVSVVNQCGCEVDERRLCQVVEWILQDAGYASGEVDIAIVDDATIWELNKRHLDHDYPTDVLSFRLDDPGEYQRLEGEIIVSADTAARDAPRYDWQAGDELLLYVIHGALHLIGLDDGNDAQREQMRAAEIEYLSRVESRLGRHHALTSRT